MLATRNLKRQLSKNPARRFRTLKTVSDFNEALKEKREGRAAKPPLSPLSPAYKVEELNYMVDNMDKEVKSMIEQFVDLKDLKSAIKRRLADDDPDAVIGHVTKLVWALSRIKVSDNQDKDLPTFDETDLAKPEGFES